MLVTVVVTLDPERFPTAAESDGVLGGYRVKVFPRDSQVITDRGPVTFDNVEANPGTHQVVVYPLDVSMVATGTSYTKRFTVEEGISNYEVMV